MVTLPAPALDDVIDRLRLTDTAAVSDALDSLGIPGVLTGIACRVPGVTMVGVAYTVTYGPVEDTTTFHNAANYIDDVPAGAVIVVDNGGSLECTNWGNILTAVAMQRGVAGTVIHGSARDIAEIRSHGYPLFSTGVSMVSGKNRVTLAATGNDIDVHGVRVSPGDVIVADDNGAIRIPRAIAEAVAERATQVDETERRIADAVRAGARLDRARSEFGYATPWEPARP
ncbi:RraA family protein [Rhodococcoides fascians A21d2]|nr:S-adenosylmethionine--2-demethylmenaquinone methyltransferase [Rhodococcus sp. 06-412-2C]OZC93877.1 S-adenosylmethionine--2-demethylmenaquinone methyltransferase [Rhodococcus sp. 06-412-2B]QII03125.1 RraA family protein [Rhodococcus fascians A21d2]